MWPFSHQNSTVVFSNSSKIRHWRKLALTKVKCYWTTIFNWSFFGGWKTLKIYNGRTLIQLPSQALLQTDNSLTGWGWGGGCSLGRNENWRDMDSAGDQDAQKRTGTFCFKTIPGNLFESTGDKVTACKDGQYSCPDLPFENGGRKEFANGLSFQTNLGNAIKEKSNCDSRVPSQQTEQACRHRNSSLDSFCRMEASPLTVSKTLYENGKAIEGPFCFQGVQHM